jgi:hypothetical protein
MSPGLRALLDGVIDYAGLFPPARLPLEQAVRQYARYRQEPDAWMLSRFVCPASRLAELAPYPNELFASGPPLIVSTLGRGGEDRATFLTGLDADLAALDAFRTRHAGRAFADTLEVRVAPSLTDFLLEEMTDRLSRSHPDVETVYVEVPLDEQSPVVLPPVIAALRQIGQRKGGVRGGFKLRCGGLDASAFPSPDRVASLLKMCRAEGVPLKFTAGLHHPIRRPDPTTGATMHGFVNVFAAAALEWTLGLDVGTLTEVLSDDDAESFRFDEDGLRWRDLRAPTGCIEETRGALAISFGSCSFDEPRDDLRALGWM